MSFGSVVRTLFRGATGRCPACGGRGLHHRWFTLRDECPRCGLRFERVDGMYVGAVGMNTVVSFGALLATLVIGLILTYPDIPVAPLLIASVAVALLAPIVFYPASRTLYAAIDILMRPLADDEAPGLRPDAATRGGPAG